MPAPSASTRPHPGWSVGLAVVLLLLSSLPALAQSTPTTADPAGDTRLYIGHDARLTARMPAHWEPDRSLLADYRGGDGFIASQSLWAINETLDSVAAQCAAVAGTWPQFGHASEVALITWRGQEACRITLTGGDDRSPVGLVFANASPSADGYNRHVLVVTDAAHFDAIVESIAFDPSLVTPEAYLDAAIDLIETAWLWRDEIDWTELRHDARSQAGDLSATGDLAAAYPALDWVAGALSRLGPDLGAAFMPADAMASPIGEFTVRQPAGASLPGGIGYLAVPGLYVGGEQETRYADTLHAAIAAQRDVATCGWLVDLRGNGGGNLYPMLGGLMPLLEPGRLLGFRDAIGPFGELEVTAVGMLLEDGQPLAWMAPWAAPPDAELAARPVAILVDAETGGSGEDIAIALRSQPGSRAFGQPTAGLTTSIGSVSLYDGAALQFSNAWVTGPLGAIYPEGLTPDVVVPAGGAATDLMEDNEVRAATAWLRDHPGCAGAAATPAS